MPSTTVTSLLCLAGDNVSIRVRFSKRKPLRHAFVNIGPWASETLPTGAVEIGVYDVHGTVDGTVYSSVCDMSRSVIETCTVSEQSGFADSTKYAMTRTKGETGSDFTLSYCLVTLTGGLAKLASSPTAIISTEASSIGEASLISEATPADDATSGSATEISTNVDATSGETTSPDTPSTAVPTETASAGSPSLVRAYAALAVAGMAAALVL
ncbi:hypothetical protein F66182_6950 [Fusarium sp. NRRL 66182]|nr:hypothetical protein F66182_6950 [Fusarium sp. NRRL 66182]